MAWFLNFYRCDRSRKIWTDQWSCTCDDECPHCGFHDMTPFNSEDLTELIVEETGKFIVLRSSKEAEDDPTIRNSVGFRRETRQKNSCAPISRTRAAVRN
jgi:hypothetical protein